MVEAVEGSNMEVDMGEQIFIVTDSDMQAVYPQSKEGLINFLERCKLNDSKIMLFPCCNVIFDEEVKKKPEGTRRFDPRRGWGESQAAKFTSNNGGRPHRNKEYRRQFQ